MNPLAEPSTTSTTATRCGPTAADVWRLLDVDRAERSVTVADDELTLPPGEELAGFATDLAVWLYVRLHVGNPAAIGLDALRPDPRLEAAIAAALPDIALPHPSDRPAAMAVVADSGVAAVCVDVDRVWVGAESAERVVLPCARPNLSPGFFMFVHEHRAVSPHELTRLYIGHDDADIALADWAECVQRLVAEDLTFRTKLLSRRSSFPRNDSIVVYVPGDGADVAALIGGDWPAAAQRRPSSPLCRELGGSVGAADEPTDPTVRAGQQSFGEHRCGVLADVIIDVLGRADDDGADTRAALIAAFDERARRSGIDPDDISRSLR